MALSAFDSFCRGAEQGRFPDLNDRDNLWRLLVVFTTRKAARLVSEECAQKRGGGKAQAEVDLPPDRDGEAALATLKAAGNKQEYADLAMRMLRYAVQSGFNDGAHMAKDKDLDLLRHREDYKKLLKSLAKPIEKKEPVEVPEKK